jgi:hypothetical protein
MNTKHSIFPILPRVVGAKFFSILLVAAIFSLASCDEASVVGLDVQPEGDLLNVGYQDSTTLITRTIAIDSLQTDESIITTGTALLGKYMDPVFGEATSSIYTQVRLISDNPNFGTNPVVDAVVLSLHYNGIYYGKRTIKPQTVNVYQISDDLKTSVSYYSDTTLNHFPLDITAGHSGYTFTALPTTDVVVGPDTLKPQLRIPIDPNFGQVIVNSGELTSDASWRDFMKGLYITTSGTTGIATSDGNIFNFNMGESQLIIYYHNEGSTIRPRNKSFVMSLGSVARFCNFTHDFTKGSYDVLADELNSQINSTTADTNNYVTFIQSMAGLKTKIETPYLMNWIDSGMIAVNKAELVIREYDASPQTGIKSVSASSIYPYTGAYGRPDKLVIFGIKDNGLNYSLPDATEGDNYFGGTYRQDEREYHFNITRYVQQVLSGQKANNGLTLFSSSGSVNANRIVIGGGAPGPYQMKLKITYTKLY